MKIDYKKEAKSFARSFVFFLGAMLILRFTNWPTALGVALMVWNRDRESNP